MSDEWPQGICFGCNRKMEPGDLCIRVGLDEWSAGEGKQAFGLDDLFTFTFCDDCTEKHPNGRWHLAPLEASDD